MTGGWEPSNILLREFNKLVLLKIINEEQYKIFEDLIISSDKDNFIIAKESYLTLSNGYQKELAELTENLIKNIDYLKAKIEVMKFEGKYDEFEDIFNKYLINYEKIY